MKKTNQFFTAMAAMLLLFSTTKILAQEAQKAPLYITVTTMHWNMDYEDFDMDTWKSVEKEYLDKVTAKNEYVMSSSFYIHNLTPDNTEIVYVKAYVSWMDIEKASEKDSELIIEAWPDTLARQNFFKKQQAYYSHNHSDEIYSTIPTITKALSDNSKDLICYIRKTHLAYPEEGTTSELNALVIENFEKLIKVNPLVKGYYPNLHAWGVDGTEMIEAFYLDSLADLEKMFDGLTELSKKAWPDEAVRKERNKTLSKYFTGVHGDYVYTLVGGLSK